MKWYRNIRGRFSLPINVKRDCDYSVTLKNELNRYYNHLVKEIGVPSRITDKIKNTNEIIIEVVNKYYMGDIKSSQSLIFDLLKSFENNEFVFNTLENCYAFRGIGPFTTRDNEDYKSELSFFKARVSNYSLERYQRSDMLHIPTNMRGLVSTQRFSIAGIPCMYFSTSSYGCWLELGKPQNDYFNVSSYKLNNKLKILNLVCVWELIGGLTSGVAKNEDYRIDLDELVADLLLIWPLVCATSFRVEERNRNFKSEYIISQLVMMSLKELGMDGVAYVSKQVTSDIIAMPNSINLAIPALECNGDYSNLCNEIELSESVNYGEFLRLSASDSYSSKRSFINRSNDYYNQIKLANKSVQYHLSDFCRFDNYLVSFHHEIVKI